MTTPRPISKSATQRANRQTADGQTDRGGREDGDRRRDGVIERKRGTHCTMEGRSLIADSGERKVEEILESKYTLIMRITKKSRHIMM